MMALIRFLGLYSFLLLALTVNGWCQSNKEMDAAQSDDNRAIQTKKRWNEFDLGFITMRYGYGFLVDTAAYTQDNASERQMDLANATQLRDARILLKGRFKHFERLSYTFGYMYDGPQDDWRIRQTGLMLDVPEWEGNFFIGRTKEGFSTSKIMVGYYGWTNERSAANDAFLPILADGVKWMGRGFGGQLVYNVGAFNEKITNYEAYDKNDEVVAARAVWLPNAIRDPDKTLHLAIEGRYGTSKDGYLQYRSKPESFPAQDYAIDTGKFKATSSMMTGLEAYYSPGPMMVGMEYYFNQVKSNSENNPFFHGGDIFGAWLLDGSKRQYNLKGGYFEPISPSRPVFKGGLGTWELVVRYSSADLTDKDIDGGRFKRITPMMNWYLSDNVRLEFVYGYSELEKGGEKGTTNYFQTRLQFSLI
jgi:phosphate-selective porin OprO/OprP